MLKARPASLKRKSLLRNEHGAIDLASIMVGVIVLGVIGGVTSATVFAVIPWTQDNAAKQQLESVVTAESAARGLNSDSGQNRYSDVAELETQSLFDATSANTAVLTDVAKTCYVGITKSDSDKVYYLTDTKPKPAELGNASDVGCVDATVINKAVEDLGAVVPEPESLMISTWDTSTTKKVVLPIRGAVEATVDWGDGTTPQVITSALPEHTYAAGITNPTVTIDGTFSQWSATTDTFTYYASANQLLTVNRWDSAVGTTDLSYAFTNARKLTSATIPATATNLNSALRGATTFNGNLSNWDTSNVTIMSNLFYGATVFNQPLNTWDTSKVTNMANIFYNARAFNGDISNWNTSNVTNLSSAFYGATLFNRDISNWNTSKVGTLANTFNQANAFDQPIGKWDTANVTTLNNTFMFAGKFNQPLNNWKVNKVTNMAGTFQGASMFNQPLNTWNTSSVTTMVDMFSTATAFNGDISTWNTVNVTNMSATFFNAKSINQSLNNWDVSKVTNLQNMFSGATAFNGNISSWNVGNVTNMAGTFYQASAFNQPLNNWNVSKVTNMSSMFARTSTFNQPLNNWTTSNVTTMASMFSEATAFNQNVSNWNVSKVTDHSYFDTNATSWVTGKPTFSN